MTRLPLLLWRWSTALVLAISLALAAPARAERFAFRHLTGDNGLSQLSVDAIVTDDRGYVWIGTWAGLNRYDGKNFRVFTLSEGLPGDKIVDLAPAGEGAVWAVSPRFLFEVEGDGTVGASIGIPEIARAISLDAERRAWIATAKGLFLLRPGASSVVPVAIAPDETDTELADVAFDESRSQVVVLTRDGRLRVGGVNGFETFSWTPPPEDQIRCFSPSPWGEFAVGIRNSIRTVSKEGARREIHLGTEEGVIAVKPAPDGAWWALTQRAAWRIAPGAVEALRIGEDEGMPAIGLRSLAFDADEGLWVGGFGGAARLAGLAFATFDERDGLPSASVRPILRRTDGSLWVGTLAGLARWTGRAFERVALPSDRIHWLMEDRDGRMWVGAEAGLFREKPEGGFVASASFGREDWVDQIVQDGQGRYWVSSRDKPIRWSRDGERFELAFVPGQEFTNARILSHSGGDVFISGSRGLSRFDGSSWKTYRETDGLNGPDPYYLYEGPDGAIWFGYQSSRGLSRFDLREFKTWTKADGLTSAAVYSLGFDAQGTLWVGTAKGVDRFDGAQFFNFDKSDGYSSAESNAGGFLRDPDGTLWFGTAEGLCRYRPSLLGPRPSPPRVTIDRPLLGKAPFVDGETVASGRRDLTVEITAPGMARAHHLAIRYRILGLSPEWRETEGPRVFVPNLGAGKYVLEASAAYRNYEWSAPTRLAWTIHGPLHASPWFRLAAAITILAIALFWLRGRGAARVRDEDIRRMRHDLRNPLSGVLGMAQLLEQTRLDAEQREYVRVIRDSGERLLASIDGPPEGPAPQSADDEEAKVTPEG